jgi:hypothetical protein
MQSCFSAQFQNVKPFTLKSRKYPVLQVRSHDTLGLLERQIVRRLRGPIVRQLVLVRLKRQSPTPSLVLNIEFTRPPSAVHHHSINDGSSFTINAPVLAINKSRPLAHLTSDSHFAVAVFTWRVQNSPIQINLFFTFSSTYLLMIQMIC